MRAAVFDGQPGPLTVSEVDVPGIGDCDALIRVAACGVCTTEVAHSRLGLPTFKQPVILGHEISGIVAEVGSAVTNVRVNDRVLLPILFPCRSCHNCRTGRDNLCLAPRVLGNVIDGGLAEYVGVPAADLIPLPASISLEEACIITDALSTPFHAVYNRARVRPGDNVCVIGCGGIGINVVQLAVLAGARVVAIDPDEDKLKLAKQLGAFGTIVAGENAIAEMRALLNAPADVSFEASGRAEVVGQALAAVQPGGVACLIGVPMEPAPIDVAAAVMGEVTVMTAFGCPTADYERLTALVAAGRLVLSPVISGRYSLDEVDAAVEAVMNSKGFKHIVVPHAGRRSGS